MEIIVDERKVWWLASYPKSGNTWVRMFINAYLSGFPLDINTGFQYVMGDNHLGFYQLPYCRPANSLTITEQIFLRPAVLMSILSLSAAKHVCIKTHHAKVKADDIPLIPPKISAGGIYIIRDPRDIVISFADHLGESIDSTIEHMGDVQYISEHKTTRLMHVLTTWSMHITTWADKNKDVPITVIRYEDMLVNPEDEFKRILKGLGFNDEVDEDKFNFAIEQTRFENLQLLESKNGFKEKGNGERFFRVGKAGQWRTILSKDQIKKIEQDHGEVMQKYGYETW